MGWPCMVLAAVAVGCAVTAWRYSLTAKRRLDRAMEALREAEEMHANAQRAAAMGAALLFAAQQQREQVFTMMTSEHAMAAGWRAQG